MLVTGSRLLQVFSTRDNLYKTQCSVTEKVRVGFHLTRSAGEARRREVWYKDVYGRVRYPSMRLRRLSEPTQPMLVTKQTK